MLKTQSLFASDAVFVADEANRNDIFKAVYQKLLDKGYVKGDFLAEIIKREDSYPTGLSTAPISKELPNIAIPHTEGEFVNARLIVPIALKTPVIFNDMINPSRELKVKFLFMILNNDPEGQANMLAMIMDFMAKTPVDKLNYLFNLTDNTKIYQFLSENFVQN